MTDEQIPTPPIQPKAKRTPRPKVTAEPTPEAEQPASTPDFIKIKEPESKFDNLRAKAIQKIMENRNRQEPEVVPAPMTQRMLDQTQREMEAGRRRVAYHAEQAAVNPAPRPREPGTTTAVFRPGDYVPDQKKGQGYTNAKTITG